MGVLSKIKFNKISGTFVLEMTKQVIDIADVVRMLERRLASLAPMLLEMLPLAEGQVDGLSVKGVEFSPSRKSDHLGVRFNIEIKCFGLNKVWRSKTPLLYLTHETAELVLPEQIRKQLEHLIQESEALLDTQQVDMFDGQDNGEESANREIEGVGVEAEPVAA